MTMPKKGTRKIVVNDKEYRYRVSGIKHYWYTDSVVETALLIEIDSNNYYKERRNGRWEVTPKYIREVIEKENKE